jgi:hypothetical protein
MERALGITPHTGWAACVVVGGSPARPEIVASARIHLLGDEERFCYHAAARLTLEAAAGSIERLRRKALRNARRALAPFLAEGIAACAIVANAGAPGELQVTLAAHPRLHAAEGFLYRDVLREACPAPVLVVPPRSLDASTVGRLAGPPWGRDQKLAALAAWAALEGAAGRRRPRRP